MKVKISKLQPNTGQIEGVPKNPRFIKDEKFKSLVRSLKQLPIMTKFRGVIVNEDYVIIGGNMRYRAAKEAGWKEIDVEVFTREDAEENNRIARELDIQYINKSYEEQVAEMIIKDNTSGGDWDMTDLANEWDSELLLDWGVDIPKTDFDDIDSFFEDGEKGSEEKHQQTTCPQCGHIFET